eukprot:TRINITY_DN106125_c0_g1_i1.p1 TRINITY_DN106125_c0_g1~~TRINITY_DN106125_c0_g1_i1.p1  ORF type:complete len:758 (-),score=85.98 TRINITY_DN106125_c0_g1_i1:363-2636(-)
MTNAQRGAWPTVTLVLAFVAFNAAKVLLSEDAHLHNVNTNSIWIMSTLISLVAALTGSFLLEGSRAWGMILSWQGLLSFIPIGMLFKLAGYFDFLAYRFGILHDFVSVFGNSYLLISAALTYVVLKRRYGKLEWMALSMLMLGACTFILLRARCSQGECHLLHLGKNVGHVSGIVLVFASVTVSALASLLAERIYKGDALTLYEDRFCPMKVHLDFSCFMVSALFWLIGATESGKLVAGQRFDEQWWGAWTWREFVLSLIVIGHSWCTGLLVKRFSTVTKSVVQTLSTLLTLTVSDPAMHKFSFASRWVPSFCIVAIAVLSVLVFYTGRLSTAEKVHSRQFDELADGSAASEIIPYGSGDCEQQGSSDETTDEFGGFCGELLSKSIKFWPIILLVFSDGARQAMQSIALGGSMMTPQIFVVLINGCGLLLANVMTLVNEGRDGLCRAWNFKKIRHFSTCGLFFALTSSLLSIAYARNISAGLANVLGKIYTPMVAIASKWILGRSYNALEWSALIILTLSSVAFGYLQQVQKFDTGGSIDIVAILCVVGSAAAACFNSLTMEKLMEDENEPFVVQKVRIDCGTVFWSIVFLPVMGLIATEPKYKFWEKRPLTQHCNQLGSCQDGIFALFNSTSFVDNGDCACGGGAWPPEELLLDCDKPAIMLSLALFVLYSWITGVVVKHFSSIHRSIADGFSLLLIYFCLDPLLRGKDWSNFALDGMALIMPFSIVTFTSASDAMTALPQAYSSLIAGSHEDLQD